MKLTEGRGAIKPQTLKALHAQWRKLSPDLSGPEGLTERVFGNYEEGRYAWFFEDIKPFPNPIPAKGNRLLWEWNEAAQ
jgi:hypothetical protein